MIAASWILHAYSAVRAMRAYVGPTRPGARPPGFTVALAWVAVALMLVAIMTRRGRAWLRMRPRLSRPSTHGAEYLAGFALDRFLVATLLAVILFVRWDYDDLSIFRLLSSPEFPRLPHLIAVAYVFVRVRSARVPLREWGWRRGRGVWREISIGVSVGMVAWLIQFLRPAMVEPNVSDLSLFGTRLVLGTVVWAPIFEETLYRGMLYRYLRDHLHWLPAVVVSSAIFALMHPIPRMPIALVSGVVYALLREWRGSLIAPVAAHASWNVLSVAAAGYLFS